MKLLAIIHYLILVPIGLYSCIKDWKEDYCRPKNDLC